MKEIVYITKTLYEKEIFEREHTILIGEDGICSVWSNISDSICEIRYRWSHIKNWHLDR